MNPKLESTRQAIRGFLDWWVGELAEMLPGRLRGWFSRGGERLVFAPEGDGYSGELEHAEGRQSLGHFAAADEAAIARAVARHGAKRAIVFELPVSDCLITDVSLPAAAEENLGQVLYYEMDRHTPFSGAQVQFGYRRLARRTAAGLIPLRLAVIPRNVLTSHLEAARACGIVPQRVRPAGDPGIDLTPAAGATRRRLRPSLRTALAGALAALFVLCIAFPLWELDQTLGMLQEEVDDLAAVASEAESLRERRDRLEAQAQHVAELRQQRPAAVAAMEQMARILPDDTWIWSFRLNGRDVTVRGETPSASRLIELIEGADMFRSAGFSAPITREGGSERFEITMALAESSG